MALKQKAEEEERIKEENRRIKEWETKFDEEQKIKEEALIKKFYSDHQPSSVNDDETSIKDNNETNVINTQTENKNIDKKD